MIEAVACSIATVAILGLAVLNKITFYRLMTTAENVLYGLRTRGFSHVHELSVANQNEAKRGVLVARVTSDIETLAHTMAKDRRAEFHQVLPARQQLVFGHPQQVRGKLIGNLGSRCRGRKDVAA